MSTFSQWWQAFGKKPQVRPVTWLCGPEKILVEDILRVVRRMVSPEDWNYVPLALGEDTERQVWSEVFTLPQGEGARRLVVVRNAERLKEPERLLEFLKRAGAHPSTYVVFVSNAAALPRLDPDEDQKARGLKGDLVEYIAGMGTKGYAIECKPFTSSTVKTALAWVQARAPMREAVAGHLLNRANGDMRLVRDTCAKLVLFGQEPTISAVNDLLSQQPRDTFVEALLAMDKKSALHALERMQGDDYARTLGLLDSNLELAGMVHDMLADRKAPFEIMKAAGSKNFLVKDIIPVSRHYDVKRRAAIRRALALADEALRGGARTGVMETVTVLW